MASSSSSNNAGKILKRANPSTIQDKFLVGYQGWFTCAGDGEPVGPGHHGWLHWFNYPIPDGGHPNTDLWPDVSSYSPSELFPAPGLRTKAGEPVFLFSSRNAKTVQRHFHWMAEHGVDGAFLQRFVGQCDLETGNEGIMRIRDEVGDRVREAAEKEGRVFAIMYDVSGVAPDRVQRILERDWAHLVRNKGVLDSPNYLRERGKPVVALWGFGFDNAKHTPALVHSVTQFFRNTTPGGVYIMAGTPASWRTAEGDADRNPGFLDIWLNDFDAISPWTVGRYSNEQEADDFMERKMKGDMELIKKHNEEGTGRKINYIPVVLPGGSGYNMSEGHWGFNNIKRRGGRFLWKQISNAKRLGVRTIYGAMWDEYDEGTAFMPVVEHKGNLPESDKFRFMALDEDGYDVPSDWYMRICGFAAEGLRSERRIHETFPVKELQDYWSSRPKYEEISHKSGDFISGSVAGGSGSTGESSVEAEGQTYQEWLASQKDDKEEAPPPPYTLEADEASPAATASSPPQSAVAAAVAPAVNVTPALNQGSHPNALQATPQVQAGTAPAVNPNTSGYTAPGPSPQTYTPSTSPASFHQQQQHRQHDTVAELTHDFGRQSISGPPIVGLDAGGVGVGSGVPSSGRIPAGSPPPLPPAHPAANNPATYGAASAYPGRQSRPQSQSRPHSQTRPGAYHTSPPQSPHAYNTNPVVPPATAVAPASPYVQEAAAPGTWSQGQWPPPEWKVTSNQPPSIPTRPHTTHPASNLPSQPHAYGAPGGANLSRPNTITASSYGGGGVGLRPSTNVSGRPPSQPTGSAGSVPSTLPGSHDAPAVIEQRPSSSYPAPNTHNPPDSYHNTTPFPQPAPSAYSPTGEAPIHGMPNFPNEPSASTYPPPISSYPGQSGSTYPGQPGGSAYQPPYGSGYAPWPSAPSSASPPHSPLGASAFSGQSTYNPSRPYNPAQGPHQQYYTGPSFPSNSASSSMPTSSPMDGPGSGLYFPQASSGEGGYFGSSSSPYPSSYPSQHGIPSSTYPGQGGPSYPQPSPWMPSGGSGSSVPPPMPPRPPTHSSISQVRPSSGPGFPATSTTTTGATALGYALTAVDKIAGRKTREQLESQVGSFAQSSSKLFNKFTR